MEQIQRRDQSKRKRITKIRLLNQIISAQQDKINRLQMEKEAEMQIADLYRQRYNVMRKSLAEMLSVI